MSLKVSLFYVQDVPKLYKLNMISLCVHWRNWTNAKRHSMYFIERFITSNISSRTRSQRYNWFS